MLRIMEKEKLDFLKFLQNVVDIVGDIKRALSQIDELPSVDDLFEAKSRINLEADFANYRNMLKKANDKAIKDLETGSEKKITKELNTIISAIQNSKLSDRKVLVDEVNSLIKEINNYVEGIAIHKENLETAMTKMTNTWNDLAKQINISKEFIVKDPANGKIDSVQELK